MLPTSPALSNAVVGKDQAIGLLSHYIRIYQEMFDGFFSTKFDGTRVNIAAGSVHTK